MLRTARLRWIILAAAAALGPVASEAVQQPQTIPPDEQPLAAGRRARVAYSWIHRAVLEAAVTDRVTAENYTFLGGNLERLSLDAAGVGAPGRSARKALFGTVKALLEPPEKVVRELANALVGEGLRAYRANYLIYRQWQSGKKKLTEQAQRDFVLRHGALERLRLGRRILTDLGADQGTGPYEPGEWDQKRRRLYTRVTEMEYALADTDLLAVLVELQPILDEARAGLEGYPPYQKHRLHLDALVDEVVSTVRILAAELEAARVMALGANMQRTGVYKTQGLRRFNEVLWTLPTGARIRGQPAVRDGTVFYAVAGRFMWEPSHVNAVDLATRQRVWSFEAPARCQSLTLAGRSLYVVCGDGSSASSLVAIDALSGTRKWVFQAPEGSGSTLSHPASDVERVYVADRRGTLYALDAGSGEEVWTLAGRPGSPNTAPTPTLADGIIYLPSGRWVDGIEAATGRKVWRAEVATGDGLVAVSDGVMYFCHRGVIALSLRTRSPLWRFEPRDRSESFRGFPAVADGKVYARDGRTLYALDASTGAAIWTFQTDEPIDWKVSPILAGGIVYIGTDGSRDPFEGSSIYAIDAKTGERLWSFRAKDRLYGSAPVVADGVVYFSCADVLYALH